jgi:fucokinase
MAQVFVDPGWIVDEVDGLCEHAHVEKVSESSADCAIGYLAAMDSPRASTFGWLVLTAANARQAAAYDALLAPRIGRGPLAGCRGACAVADAHDTRIGSGAATVLALAEVARRILRVKPARTISGLFAGERVLVLHSGGDSRRLPMYAVEGKLFAPIPRLARGFRCARVFDLLLDDLAALSPRDGGEVLVGAGDAVLGLARDPVRFAGAGVIGIAQRASAARAARHGVFVCGKGDRVKAFLQKPGEAEMRAARALDRQGRALVDLGLFSFDPASVEALLSGAGVRLRAGRIAFVRGGLAELASRAALPSVDLYREIAMALPAPSTREAYLATCGAGALARPLGALFDALRGTPFRVQLAGIDDFLHIGSMREMLDACCGAHAALSRFGVAGLGANTVALDAHPPVKPPRGRVVVDACDARGLSLGGDNIVAGIGGRLDGEIPRGFAVFGVPLRSGGEAVVACHVDDDFKTALPEGGTLWDARLWCKADARDALALVRWTWQGGDAPVAWRRARKWSLRELVAQAGASGRAGLRAMYAREANSLLSPETPFGDARAAATLAETFDPDSRVALQLRARAFEAVADAVLSQCALPPRPQPAAILHDQAVWTSMPVRVDLAGGWTDTPPICNEAGGAVVNVALTLRGQLPIQVVAKLEDEPVIRITSTDLGQTCVIRHMRDLARRGDPTRWSSLAENALVLTGAAPADPKTSLRTWLEAIGGGISLTLFSAVPKGSGLGTSSILGAATIHALDRVFGRQRSVEALVAATSALEQLLGSRGGWQDQVGGVVGGFKLARTRPGDDQRPRIGRIDVPARAAAELASRSLLYFTGERRMAKNILENVVWNWLVHEPAAVEAVRRLHDNAERMHAALAAGDVEGAVAELDEYRECKRRIDPGSCPAAFVELSARWKRELSSWCLAGAGGGGFMLLVARDARAARVLSARIEREAPHPRARAFPFEVDPTGLRCAVL